MKIIPLALIMLCTIIECYSQDRTKKFKLVLPENKVLNSQYSSLRFIDSRADTTTMGSVQTGMLDAQAAIVSKPLFSVQLNDVFNALTNTSIAKKELLFQLRQLRFSEATNIMAEEGTCSFRASLYARQDDHYLNIASIDTTITLRSSIDVTNPLLKAASDIVTSFVASNLSVRSSDSFQYSRNDILKIDSAEKRNLKLYNVSNYVSGLYFTYQSFKNQTPDVQVSIKEEEGNIKEVKAIDANGKSLDQKIKSKKVYAIVYNGKPYMATAYGYYPLEKRKDDFFFTGKVKVTANGADVIAASLMFGIIGAAIASDASEIYEVKIDHVNGKFIPIGKILQDI